MPKGPVVALTEISHLELSPSWLSSQRTDRLTSGCKLLCFFISLVGKQLGLQQLTDAMRSNRIAESGANRFSDHMISSSTFSA